MSEAYTHGERFVLPVLPLKNVVALPKSIIPVAVGRTLSIEAVEHAMKEGRELFVTTQRSSQTEHPGPKDVYTYGIRATVLQVGRLQDGTLKILIEGVCRSRICEVVAERPFLSVQAEDLIPNDLKKNIEKQALARSVESTFREYIGLNDKTSEDLLDSIRGLEDDLGYLTDTVAVQMDFSLEKRQKVLETVGLKQRALKVSGFIQDEISILQTERNIRKRVQSQVEKNQKDYYLNEQIRAIHRELGREDHQQEIVKLRERARKAKLPAEGLERVESECRRLEQMQPTSPEASVSRNYIEWVLSVPWSKTTKDRITLDKATSILDKSHARMKKPKERIIEFLAAKKFAKDKMKKSPIICLAGPPGVGKTSLAGSIAEALGRKMVRISLGGMRDEAEIRGHRRTYIGALPGKIIQAMKRAGVMNPVILFDEIDKMASDFRGDPAAALLEVLDPEQNKGFVDHFLEIEYDLSQVMFITTANVYDAIPYALLDRMEVIHLSGYTVDEKIQIAQNHLLPKLYKEHGLRATQVVVSEPVVRAAIEFYTKEAGVRQLERVLAKILRKGIQELLGGSKKRVTVTVEQLEGWMGADRFRLPEVNKQENVGLVTGLAWTEVGGDLLEIEVSLLKGKGGVTLTGQLGEVMQESAQAALSYIRSQAKELKIPQRRFTENDIHLHLPEGAVPKDGPSAGIGIATVLGSALTGRKVKAGIAMTGEISLRGRVLPVGGLKEKLLAAARVGIAQVFVPKSNEKDIKEFLPELKGALTITYVDHIDQVLEAALLPLDDKKSVRKKRTTKK